MVWYAWALVINLVLSMGMQIYLIERPKVKTHGEAILGCIELALMIWAVVALATS